MPPLVGKGAICVAFVRPSVAYTANNSRTKRPSVHKFGRKVPHLRCDSHSSFKDKRSKVKVTRIVRHIVRTARPTYFKLGTRMEGDDLHQPQAPWSPKSEVKVARSRDQSEPSCPNVVPVWLETGGRIPCRPNQAATLLVLMIMNQPMNGMLK